MNFSHRCQSFTHRFWEVPSSLLLAIAVPVLLNIVTPVQPSLAQTVREGQIPDEANVVYVNPQIGDNINGEGSERSPWKTITQALKMSPPQSLIVLSPGTYSAQTGEQFPLLLKSEVIIQGTSGDRGRNVIIQGNGTFISPTSGSQQVAIAAVHQAGGLKGITIINSHPQGYGLWIESASPQVSENTFTRNGSAGVAVTGNSSPIIRKNSFVNNGKIGLLVEGTATPQIQDNRLERTGVGIKVRQHAVPVLSDNHLSYNAIGVILEDNAQGKLRNNIIEFSSQGALVKGEQANADLGNEGESQSNIFRSNYGSDPANLDRTQTMVVLNNRLNDRVESPVDLGEVTGTSPSNLPLLPPSGSSSAVYSREISLSPAPLPNSGNIAPSLPPSPPPPQNLTIPEKPVESTTPTTPSSTEVREISLTARQPNSTPPKPEPDLSHLNLPVVSPPPQSLSTSTVGMVPETNSSPSVSTKSPSVNPGRKSLADLLVVSPGLPSNSGSKSPSNSLNIANREQYRVMAVAGNNSQAEAVRSLYPDAFTAVHDGQSLLQVGVFSSRENAETALQSLENVGVKGIIAP